MINETYQELKKRHQKEVNAFEHWFFAFSNEQLAEGLQKHNVTTKDIVSIGNGGFVLRSHMQELKDIFNRHEKERKQNRKDRKNLLEALVYQLKNHEYCITYDESDALDALGLKVEEIPREILDKAKQLAI